MTVFVLTMAQPLMAMSEFPQQLVDRVSVYVKGQYPQSLTGQDLAAMQELGQDYAASVRDIYEQNRINYDRFNFTCEQVQYIEEVIADAQSADDLIFAEVSGRDNLWDAFMRVEDFFQYNDQIEEVQLYKRWLERSQMLSQQ